MNLRLAAACLLALSACASPEATPQGAVATVVLVRHAQAVKNVDHAPDLTEEQLDVLTPLGREQAQALARELATGGATVDRVLCSPTGRTRETAAAIAAAAGVTVVESASFSSFPSESVDDARRALAALDGYEGTTVVVTHGDVIAALTGEVAGTSPAERWARHEIPAAATVSLERRDGAWRVAR